MTRSRKDEVCVGKANFSSDTKADQEDIMAKAENILGKVRI